MVVTTLSQAETWKKIYIPINKNYIQEIFINEKFKLLSNGRIKVSFKEYVGFVGSYDLHQVEIDCKKNDVTDLGGQLFDKNGKLTKFDIAKKSKINLKTDTTYKFIFNEACNLR